jgi:hypothetical protein
MESAVEESRDDISLKISPLKYKFSVLELKKLLTDIKSMDSTCFRTQSGSYGAEL